MIKFLLWLVVAVLMLVAIMVISLEVEAALEARRAGAYWSAVFRHDAERAARARRPHG